MDNLGQGVIREAGKPLGAQSFSSCPHRGSSKCPAPAPALSPAPVIVPTCDEDKGRGRGKGKCRGRAFAVVLMWTDSAESGSVRPLQLYPLNVRI